MTLAFDRNLPGYADHRTGLRTHRTVVEGDEVINGALNVGAHTQDCKYSWVGSSSDWHFGQAGPWDAATIDGRRTAATLERDALGLDCEDISAVRKAAHAALTDLIRDEILRTAVTCGQDPRSRPARPVDADHGA